MSCCGLPIINNNIGGIVDYTIDTIAELLPIGDVEGMTNSLLRLTKNPREREKKGKGARLHSEQNFSLNHITRKTFEVYNEILSN